MKYALSSRERTVGISLHEGKFWTVHDCAGAWQTAGAMPGPSRIYCCIAGTYCMPLLPFLLSTVYQRTVGEAGIR